MAKINKDWVNFQLPEKYLNKDSKTKDFIKKFLSTYGEVYTFENTEYIRAHDKVLVNCSVHGDFEISPTNLLGGKSCRRCKFKFRNTKEFVEACIQKFGNKFDYSLVDYKTYLVDVDIICHKHGLAKQKPNNHYKSDFGCEKCAREHARKNSSFFNNLNQDDFLDRSLKLWGNRWGYEKTVYQKNDVKVKILCKEHGYFTQAPRDHWAGKLGCRKCEAKHHSLRQLKDTEWFIKESIKAHGNRYDYSKSNYTGIDNKVLITCKNHGDFWQQAWVHKGGSNCPKCGLIKLKRTKRKAYDFISTSKRIWGDGKFDYSRVKYEIASVQVELRCIEHDCWFWQVANSHINKNNGCDVCKSKPTSNFEIEVHNELSKLGYDAICQKKFKDCRLQLPLPFDFYIPAINTLIEVQGEHHYKPITFFGGIEQHQTQLIKDRIKKEYAKNNGFNFFEVPYWEKSNINSFLKQKLNNQKDITINPFKVVNHNKNTIQLTLF